jgi:SAM-dependent methyltransferase
MTDASVTPDAAAAAFVDRLFEQLIGAMDLFHLYVGDRLGLYEALAAGPLDSHALAERASVSERYAREWLQQQAVAGVLTLDADGRFALPAGHAEVLLDGDSLTHFAPVGRAVVGVAGALPELLEAFRSGGGVPYESYGEDLREAIARLNRPMFLNQLGTEWFPEVADVHERLAADPPARVADVGCGSGWSSIAIALAYPNARVTGIDLDRASIETARRNAMDAGVADRVQFEVRDAADPSLSGRFDLVCAFETIHDMCDPIGALAAMRGLRAEGGCVLVADERVADEFTLDVEPTERFQWAFSALHCLPCALTDPPAAGTGTVMRTPLFREYATSAGFADVEVLPIQHEFWRFYRLHG